MGAMKPLIDTTWEIKAINVKPINMNSSDVNFLSTSQNLDLEVKIRQISSKEGMLSTHR